MKKLLLVFLLCPCFVMTAHAEGLYEQAADMADIYQVEKALDEEERALSGRLLLDGSYDGPGALQRLWSALIAELTAQLRENLAYAAQMLALAVLCAVLRAGTSDSRMSAYIDIAGSCAAALLFAGNLEGVITQATDALLRLSDYSRAALPAIFTAAAFTGAVGSASARYAAVCLAMDVIMSALLRFVLPLLYAFLALSISRSVFDNSLVNAVHKFLKWCVTMSLTAITLCFSAYISITGVIAGSTDAVAVKTTRTVISTALPVVGGILSDSASVLLSAAAVIKNAAGAFSLVAVCALCIGPFALLSVKMFLFKLAAAASDMLPNSRLSRLIADLSTVYGMLLGMIGSCAIMLFISIMSGIKVVTS